MINGEVFSLSIPRLNLASRSASDVEPADGCTNNTNYYTDGLSRGTCCCGCDKAEEEL